jgi:tyrosinase
VLIFLGDVPDDPEQWRTSPSYVGPHVAYVNAQPDKFGNMRERMISSSVHLNDDIAEKSGLSSFEPSIVVPYLRENSHWRV